jgi:hypothetical protein
MRVVIMPFVESEQDPASLGEYRQIVERDGELLPNQVIGCQLYMSSGMEETRFMVTNKEAFFEQATSMLPKLVKRRLDPQGFYDVPDPAEVDQVTEKAANMPTELFVLIQNQYDPEYLFLPEINYFFFRYPRLHTTGTGIDSGFGFVQISAFLLDNRQNRIVIRGSGMGLGAFNAGEAVLDENYNITLESQMEVMLYAGDRAVDSLLKAMKMTR